METVSLKSPRQQIQAESINTTDNCSTSEGIEQTIDSPEKLEKLVGTSSYDSDESMSFNILQAVRNGTFPTSNRIILKNICFQVPEGEVLRLPSNVRLQYCEITQGELFFSVDQRTSPVVFATEAEFLSGIGLHYTYKNITQNLVMSIERNYFPTVDVTLGEFRFVLGAEDVLRLPDNVFLNNCWLSSGCVKFSKGKLTAAKDGAIAYANGKDAESRAITPGALAYANRFGSAYAECGGKSFALSEGSHAYASGEKSKAFGLIAGSKLHLSKGATGRCNVVGVEVPDPGVDTHWGPSARTVKTPKYFGLNNIHYSKERYEKFFNHLVELDDLANAGCPDSALKLGLMEEEALRSVFGGDDSKKVFYLKKALRGYEARDKKTGRNEHQKEIDQINVTLNAELASSPCVIF